jgi:hypothetical protein
VIVLVTDECVDGPSWGLRISEEVVMFMRTGFGNTGHSAEWRSKKVEILDWGGCRRELPLRWRCEFEAIESTVEPIN